MRANHTLEIGTGLFVLLGFAALLFLTTQLPASGLKFGSAKSGYHVTAEFDDIGDLKVGSAVTMAGVRIGDVSAIRFDSKAYKAVVAMRINPQFQPDSPRQLRQHPDAGAARRQVRRHQPRRGR